MKEWLFGDKKRVITLGIVIIAISAIFFLAGQARFASELSDLRAFFGLTGNEGSLHPAQLAFNRDRAMFYLPGERMRDNAIGGMVVGAVITIAGFFVSNKKTQKDLLSEIDTQTTQKDLLNDDILEEQKYSQTIEQKKTDASIFNISQAVQTKPGWMLCPNCNAEQTFVKGYCNNCKVRFDG